MEMEAVRFYQRAASRVTHAGTRELLNKLADEERKHTETAGNLEEKHLTEHARAREDESTKKLFLLQVIQPGLAGLMDGSVSTLAPLFAAAYASHKTWEAFLVGMAASLGAGPPCRPNLTPRLRDQAAELSREGAYREAQARG